MQTVYKIFLVLFIIFIGINIYAINWNIGFFHPENTTYLFSAAAGILGTILAFALNMWSKLSTRK